MTRNEYYSEHKNENNDCIDKRDHTKNKHIIDFKDYQISRHLRSKGIVVKKDKDNRIRLIMRFPQKKSQTL